jgi:hypothetical protein
VIAATRLRGGNAASCRGAASFAGAAVRTARATGCSGTLVARADSAFYSAAFTSAVRAAGAFFSVTVQMNPHVKAAIAAIGEDAWTPIKYPRAIWDDQLACWVSDAQVAEVKYTAFTSTDQPITARLIVRRVKDLTRAEGQGELFPVWRYHAVFTDSPFVLLQAEEHHRDHAQVEQVCADLADGPLAHLPSGSFPANAAWLACAAISHNLLRAAGSLASLACAKARGATLRRGPHRCRRPHGPPRPRPHHLAPARRLAPRAGLDQPLRSRLRTARPGGLTSPDPVHAPGTNGTQLPQLPRPRQRHGRAAEK